MGRSIRFSLASAVVGTLLGGACSSDSPSKQSSGFSVQRLLAQVPSSAIDDESSIIVSVGDFDAASELADVQRPTVRSTDKQIAAWGLAISGIPRSDDSDVPKVSMFLPGFLTQSVVDSAEVDDELGFSLLDATSYVEYPSPPHTFTVFGMDIDDSDLTKAIGRPDDGVWKIGDEEGVTDLQAISAARPIGESLRIGHRDDFVGIARASETIADWLDRPKDTLATDEVLADIAEHLDDAEVYTAYITNDVASVDDSIGAANPPEDAAAIDTADYVLEGVDAVGVGLSVVKGHAVATIVYHQSSNGEATANAERIEDLISSANTLQSGKPFNELLDFDHADVDGSTMIATLRFQDDVSPSIIDNMLLARDLLFVHR